MPELPEVETIVRRLRPRVSGRRIRRFVSLWAKQASPSVRAVESGLRGRAIVDLRRRGKHIVFDLDDERCLLLHLRMSGRLELSTDGDGAPAHVRAFWEFDDGERLLFCDARKFGRIALVDDFEAATAHLGVEPLSRGFNAAWLSDGLRRRRRALKPLLLDQSFIAGLGNIYADEALFRAGLHPLRLSDTLRQADVDRLRAAIRDVLKIAIRRQGTTIDWIYPGGQMQDYLAVYGRAGQPCVQCGGAIERIVVAQRGTHVCRRCQPRKGSA